MKKINFNFIPENYDDGNTAANALAKKVGHNATVCRTETIQNMFRCDVAEARKIIIDAMKKNENVIFVP